MLTHLYHYLLTTLVFLAVDLLWLGVVARDFYQRELAAFLGPVRWWAAIPFYLIYIAGILVFAVSPALASSNAGRAALLGAFFGFVAYATYDLTNLATLRNWPLTVTAADLVWGAILTASVAYASFHIGRWLGL